MKRVWMAMVMALFAAAPATAVVVIEEDFEDDIVDESMFFSIPVDENGDDILDDRFDGTFPERGIGTLQNQMDHINNFTTGCGNPNGCGPSNPANRPGTWIPNQYKVGSPTEDGLGYQGGQWFDNLDMFPDTDWQTAVVTDFRQMSINVDGPPRQGNEGFIINHHQGDCSASNPCDNPDRKAAFTSHKLAREGFIKFSDANGQDVVATTDDVIRGSILIAPTEGVPVLGFANDIQALADSTGLMDTDINGDLDPDRTPLSKWNVGFGEPFNPIPNGIPAWQAQAIQPEVAAIIGFSDGFNQTYTMTWKAEPQDAAQGNEGDPPSIENCQVCSLQVHLTPDSDQCAGDAFALGNCEPALAVEDQAAFGRAINNIDPFYRYSLLEFEFTVGDTNWSVLKLNGFDVMACDTANASKDCDDEATPGSPMAGNVPLTRPGDMVDGFFLGTSGPKNGNSFFFDEICITINEDLAGACTFTQGNGGGPDPTLLGDANNDNQVTGSDLIAVQQNFAKVYPSDPSCDGLGPGDANDDCQVTGSDLISVQQNFGKVLQTAPVPEPAVVGLLGLGVVSLLRRRSH